jgi:hypothetical protein
MAFEIEERKTSPPPLLKLVLGFKFFDLNFKKGVDYAY